MSITLAEAAPTLEPAEGFRFHEGRAEAWAGWKVRYKSPRLRKKASFLLYDEHLNRETLALAIAAHEEERDR